MKDRLDRHQERLTSGEKRTLWQRVRPHEAAAHRETTIRRWSISFGVAAVAVVIVAVAITERNRERAAQTERSRTERVRMESIISPGPLTADQLREVALSRSTGTPIYDTQPRAAPVRSPGEGRFLVDLLVGRRGGFLRIDRSVHRARESACGRRVDRVHQRLRASYPSSRRPISSSSSTARPPRSGIGANSCESD
jgi:hypothetical protein